MDVASAGRAVHGTALSAHPATKAGAENDEGVVVTSKASDGPGRVTLCR